MPNQTKRNTHTIKKKKKEKKKEHINKGTPYCH